MNGRLRIGACLSLSGRFAQFGRQAARGLEAWRALDANAELVIEDDRSDRRELEGALPDVAARSDLLLGPYSTILARAASRVAADLDRLVWNHGGSGDDVQQAHPGHMVSVLTPASRYGEPFIQILAGDEGPERDLCIIHGGTRFGLQVAGGAVRSATQIGINVVEADPDGFPPSSLTRDWDLFSVGVFEQDAELAAGALRLPHPPRRLCTVSAGVQEFARAVDNPEGVYGIAQWFPGSRQQVLLGPSEEDFLRTYASSGGVPEYPAVQAAASALIACQCARLAGSSQREALWGAATGLITSTLFGAYRIDSATGAQVAHKTTLVRWIAGKLARLPAKE